MTPRIKTSPPDEPSNRPAGTSVRMTAKEIEDEIHSLARNGEGADKRWALQKLKGDDATEAIPKPATQEELVQRISRLLTGAGVKATLVAFGKAYPSYVPPGWKLATAAGMAYLPRTLDSLYKMFPEAAKDESGAPPDFPHDQTLNRKRRWIAQYAHSLARQRGSHPPPSPPPGLPDTDGVPA